MVEVVRSPKSLIVKEIQRFFLKQIFQHLLIRALSQENGAIARLFITDKLDFSKTLDKQKQKLILLGILLHQIVQMRSPLG
ncbi:hypothetical protein QUB80_10695 [Chlorogloeopsis sp. ULAP01]|uniref:hypothetical protein n=1 Tax=Chlorogloeopsis sp. ULAP01 TaxID=3056483 RepID=UPI0025AB1A8F|nr:hypothetical protein [Chlorogloeopsis sp. ULAP01]MDM9381171.1 hypothetical protein [Chlorogloeopsis sp. ULAP01]